MSQNETRIKNTVLSFNNIFLTNLISMLHVLIQRPPCRWISQLLSGNLHINTLFSGLNPLTY